MVPTLDELSELPRSDTDAPLCDDVRTWLIEHLIGDFRNHLHRGGPDDDDNWELRTAWEAELATRAETIYAGTSETEENIISERVLGMPHEPKPGR